MADSASAPTLKVRNWTVNPQSYIEYKPQTPAPIASKYTFHSPHTCQHCQQIVLDAAAVFSSATGGYSTATIKAPYGFRKAVEASSEGCCLYEWCLDHLALESFGYGGGKFTSNNLSALEPLAEVEFILVFETDELVADCAVQFEFTESSQTAADVVSTVFTNPQVRLSVCSRQDGILPNNLRPPETDVLSPKSQKFAKDSFSTCSRYHEQCRAEWLRKDAKQLRRELHYTPGDVLPDEKPISLDDMPTRLLHLQQHDYGEDGSGPVPRVKLVECKKLDSLKEKQSIASGGYAILSYCWGPSGNPVQLTSATHATLKSGNMPASILPATIADAITASLALGLRYFWVDALCIFQDDNKDKESEIARMGSYYRCGSVTISAASASATSEGLNSKRGDRILHSQGGPVIQLPCRVGEDKSKPGSILLSYPRHEEAAEPITNRGWTMQESLLSRRLLIFSDQLYWCCVTANAECEGPLRVLPPGPNRNFDQPPSLIPGVFPGQVMRDQLPEWQWLLGLEQFSCRRLGLEGDKLVAISAFAEYIHARFRVWGVLPDAVSTIQPRGARVYGDTVSYVAGIFVSPESSWFSGTMLGWETLHPTACRRTEQYRAPSWSWASIEGEISVDYRAREWSVCVVGYDVELSQPGAIYGNIKKADLRLRATVVPIRYIKWLFAQSADSDQGVKLRADSQVDQVKINQAVTSSSPSASDNVYLLFGSESLKLSIAELSGLVLYYNSGPGSFERLGTFDGTTEGESATEVTWILSTGAAREIILV